MDDLQADYAARKAELEVGLKEVLLKTKDAVKRLQEFEQREQRQRTELATQRQALQREQAAKQPQTLDRL